MSLAVPKGLKKLVLFLGSVNCINKIIPNLSKKPHTTIYFTQISESCLD